MKTLFVEIGGMHCDGCADTINALLRLEAGVQASSVSFKDRNARILYDPMITHEDRLIQIIQHAGFTATQTPS